MELSWQAPPECPPTESIEREISRLAGPTEGQTVRAQVVVSHTAGQRWRVVIELSGSAAGHRELTADNCTQLSKAAALIIALAANPEAALDLPTEDPPADTRPGPASAPPPIDTPPPASQRAPEISPVNPSSTDINFGVFAALGYDRGSLPLPAGLVRIGGTIQYAWTSASLSLDLTESKNAEFVGGYGAMFRSVGGQWLGCGVPLRLPFRAQICVGPRLEQLTAIGYGNSQNLNRRVWRPAGMASLALAYAVGSRFHLGAQAELLGQLRRPRFIIENINVTLYEPSRLALRALLVAELGL